jgi:hypothetical protein
VAIPDRWPIAAPASAVTCIGHHSLRRPALHPLPAERLTIYARRSTQRAPGAGPPLAIRRVKISERSDEIGLRLLT